MNYFIYFTSKQTKFRKTRDTVWHESFAIFLAIRKNEFPPKKKSINAKIFPAKIYSRVNILWQKFATQKYCIKGLFIWRWGTPGRWGNTLRLVKKITLLYMQISYKGRLGGLPTLKRLHGKTWPCLRGLPGLADQAIHLGRSLPPPPLHHVNVIKLKWENIWTGGVTPPKLVTSPTWGPPPPCKQTLRNRVCLITTHLFHSETKQYTMNWFYIVYAYLSTVWKYVFLLHPDCMYLTRTKTLSMLGTGYFLKIAKN